MDLKFTPLRISSLSPDDIGRPVQHKQQKECEYGILTGYNATHVFVHFNNLPGALVLRDHNLFFVKVLPTNL